MLSLPKWLPKIRNACDTAPNSKDASELPRVPELVAEATFAPFTNSYAKVRAIHYR